MKEFCLPVTFYQAVYARQKMQIQANRNEKFNNNDEADPKIQCETYLHKFKLRFSRSLRSLEKQNFYVEPLIL